MLQAMVAAARTVAPLETARVAAGNSGSSDGSSSRGPRARRKAEIRQLKERISNLQERVAEMQRDLDKQKGLVQAEQVKTKKVQKELDELNVKSQRWKLYYNLYMRDLGRRGAAG